jgi:hypothetical protein
VWHYWIIPVSRIWYGAGFPSHSYWTSWTIEEISDKWWFSECRGSFVPSYPFIIPSYGFWMFILCNLKIKTNVSIELSSRCEACEGILVYVLQVGLVP